MDQYFRYYLVGRRRPELNAVSYDYVYNRIMQFRDLAFISHEQASGYLDTIRLVDYNGFYRTFSMVMHYALAVNNELSTIEYLRSPLLSGAIQSIKKSTKNGFVFPNKAYCLIRQLKSRIHSKKEIGELLGSLY